MDNFRDISLYLSFFLDEVLKLVFWNYKMSLSAFYDDFLGTLREPVYLTHAVLVSYFASIWLGIKMITNVLKNRERPA